MMYIVSGVNDTSYWKKKWNGMKKKGSKRNQQMDGRLYSSLLPLANCYHSQRLVEMKICFHHFRKVIIAAKMLCFPEKRISMACIPISSLVKKKFYS